MKSRAANQEYIGRSDILSTLTAAAKKYFTSHLGIYLLRRGGSPKSVIRHINFELRTQMSMEMDMFSGILYCTYVVVVLNSILFCTNSAMGP